MALFQRTKKPIQSVEYYQPPEQPSNMPKMMSVEDQLENLKKDLAILSSNDQLIFNAIAELRNTILELADVPEPPVPPMPETKIVTKRK